MRAGQRILRSDSVLVREPDENGIRPCFASKYASPEVRGHHPRRHRVAAPIFQGPDRVGKPPEFLSEPDWTCLSRNRTKTGSDPVSSPSRTKNGTVRFFCPSRTGVGACPGAGRKRGRTPVSSPSRTKNGTSPVVCEPDQESPLPLPSPSPFTIATTTTIGSRIRSTSRELQRATTSRSTRGRPPRCRRSLRRSRTAACRTAAGPRPVTASAPA
jgi:hypothetical protein